MGNGFDINNFGSLISNLGKTAASLEKDQTKIDTKSELNTYVSGWDAIKAKAEADGAQQADISALEGDMKSELASLMGAEFGKSAGVNAKEENGKAVFSDEDISLENMMAMLEPEDDMDINKLREYNKIPLATQAEETQAMETLTEAGFDPELVDVLVDETPGAIRHITDAIKSGKADRIALDAAMYDYGKSKTDADIIGSIRYFGIQ